MKMAAAVGGLVCANTQRRFTLTATHPAWQHQEDASRCVMEERKNNNTPHHFAGTQQTSLEGGRGEENLSEH